MVAALLPAPASAEIVLFTNGRTLTVSAVRFDGDVGRAVDAGRW